MESTIASMTKEEVLKISLTCGKLLLTSGAETYRVEDTMTRICALRDMQIAAVSTPSWIMVGDETVDGTSMVSRVTRRGTDLTLISEVNNISYHMPTWDHSFAETMAMLDELSARPSPTALYSMVWSGFAGGFFARRHWWQFLGFCGSLLGLLPFYGLICLVRPFRPSSFGSDYGRRHHLFCHLYVSSVHSWCHYGICHWRRNHALFARYGFYQRNPGLHGR